MPFMVANAVAATTAPPVTLPHLPEAPIFDAPYNPFGELDASALDQLRAAAIAEFIDSILKSSRKLQAKMQAITMSGFVVLFVFSAALLVHIRRNRQQAFANTGDGRAHRKIVLPAFEPLLWLLSAIAGGFVVFHLCAMNSDVFTVYASKVSIECMYAGHLFVNILVPLFMLQSSLAVAALRRTVGFALAISLFSVPMVWVMDTYGDAQHQKLYYWLLQGERLPIVLFFLYVFVWPPARASARTMREFCAYVIGNIVLMFAAPEAFHQGNADLSTNLAWAAVGYACTLSFFIWRVLRADTEHWRGIGKRAVQLQAAFRRKNVQIDEHVSSEGLHVLIEMHRKYIIDFSQLEFHNAIDAGENTVFGGFLHSKKTSVAIKVYMPETFTEETVAAFSHEAALCGALQHPNIVSFHGLCVCPPQICFVTELCQSSLRSVVNARGTSSSVVPPRRQQLLVDLAYMVDAARAIAYIHSFSPPFIHRDINPAHFLVDADGNLKLTHFGASRATTTCTLAVCDAEKEKKSSSLTATGSNPDPIAAPEYTAPEVFCSYHNGGPDAYGEASDVFALAMTMWDLLNNGDAKYPRRAHSNSMNGMNGRPGSMSSQEVVERVVSGHRPGFLPNVHEGLRVLLESSWQQNPMLRPTAAKIVKALEGIEEEVAAGFAMDLAEEVFETSAQQWNPNLSGVGVRQAPVPVHRSFAGTLPVDVMRSREFVGTPGEALRMGNLLMDAGFLHHVKHASAFEYSSAQYFFDDEHIAACQPITLLEAAQSPPRQHRHHHHNAKSTQDRAGRLSATSSQCKRDPARSSSVLLEQTSRRACPCRELSQHLNSQQASRRRIRHKFKTRTNENLLTAELLMNDQHDMFPRLQEDDGLFDSERQSDRLLHTKRTK